MQALRVAGEDPQQIIRNYRRLPNVIWEGIQRGLMTGMSATGALMEPIAEAETRGVRGLPLAKEMAGALMPWRALPAIARGVGASIKGKPYHPGEMMAQSLEAERGARLPPKQRMAVGLGGDILGDPASFLFPAVKAVALVKKGATMLGILSRAEKGVKVAEEISQVARNLAPKLAVQTVRLERVPEKLIRKVATTLADETYLRQVGKEALDFAAVAPRTGVRWGIGKYSAEVMSPETVAGLKAGFGKAGRFLAQEVPGAAAIPKVFGPRYLEEATLAPGAARRVGELVADFRTRRQGLLNWASRVTQRLGMPNWLVKPLAGIKASNLTVKEGELLTTLHAKLDYGDTAIRATITELEGLLEKATGEGAAMLRRRVEGWRRVADEPAEAIVADLAPERQAVLMNIAKNVVPKITRTMYFTEAIPKETARLTRSLDVTRRLLEKRQGLDDLVAELAAPIPGVGPTAASLPAGIMKRLRGLGFSGKALEQAATVIKQAPDNAPGWVSVGLRELMPSREAILETIQKAHPTVRDLEQLLTTPLSKARGTIARAAAEHIRTHMPGYHEAYLPGLPETRTFRRAGGRLGEARAFYKMEKTFKHPLDRVFATQGLEEFSRNELQRAETAVEKARAVGRERPELLEAALKARGKAESGLKRARLLTPQQDVVKTLYARTSSQAISGLRKDLMENLRQYAKPTREVKGVVGWVRAPWEEFKGSRLALPQEIVEAVQKMVSTVRKEGPMADLGRLLGGYTQWWKGTATALWPRWISLNFIGNKVNAWLGGLSNPQRYFEGFVMSLRKVAPDMELGTFIEKVIPDTSRIGQFKRAIVAKVFKDGYETKLYGRLSVEKVLQEAERHGATTGFTGAEFGLRKPSAWRDLKSWFSVDAPYLRPGMAVNELIERTDKMALFLDRLKKGDNFAQAARHAKKFLLDYADLTPTEQTLFKQVSPFYTWLRKNFQLQMQMLIEQPGKPAAIMKARAAAERAGEPQVRPEDMPEWFESAQATRVPAKGEPRYILARTPPQELAGYLDPRQMLGSLHPLIQAVIAAGTRRDPYTGRATNLRTILMNLTPVTSTYGRVFQAPIEQGIPPEEARQKQKEQFIGMLTGYRPYRLNLERAAEATRMREQGALTARRNVLQGLGKIGKSKAQQAAAKRMRRAALKHYPPWSLPPEGGSQ